MRKYIEVEGIQQNLSVHDVRVKNHSGSLVSVSYAPKWENQNINDMSGIRVCAPNNSLTAVPQKPAGMDKIVFYYCLQMQRTILPSHLTIPIPIMSQIQNMYPSPSELGKKVYDLYHRLRQLNKALQLQQNRLDTLIRQQEMGVDNADSVVEVTTKIFELNSIIGGLQEDYEQHNATYLASL